VQVTSGITENILCGWHQEAHGLKQPRVAKLEDYVQKDDIFVLEYPCRIKTIINYPYFLNSRSRQNWRREVAQDSKE
jgi:hypothetical protein